MPEDNNKKKGSKKQQKQNVSINVEGQKEQALRNQDQEKLNAKEPQGKEKGKSGGGLFRGLLKGIVNFIKGIANAIFDMPQQEQSDNRDTKFKEDPIQPESVLQGEWLRQSSQEIEQVTEKRPEHLDQEKVIEAGKGLQELGQRPDAGNQSIGIKSPDHTPVEAAQEKGEKQIG